MSEPKTRANRSRRKGKGSKPPKALPSRWLRAKSGCSYSYIIECGDELVTGRGDRYRLQSLCIEGLRASDKRWTEEEIRECCTFLKNKPTAAMIRAAIAKNDERMRTQSHGV